ncbi:MULTISPECIES: hypothetical protein [Salinibacter]|jgi:hypothetical protein|uniref:hypothetical protein n=1 Tax=Salinibacter TaxID=146918 RepID=UPI0021690E69|nr:MULTISPECIES: hypothetical protein [Salinibacter]MCS3643221.1 hypothetical protein [Salinibacter ruber]
MAISVIVDLVFPVERLGTGLVQNLLDRFVSMRVFEIVEGRERIQSVEASHGIAE